MRDAGEYRPTLPADEWASIRLFVLAVVTDVASSVAYAVDALLHVVTYHVHWSHHIAGLELERDVLFRRDVIGHSVATMPTSSPSTMGRTRSMLLRVGEALGVIEVPAPLPPLAAANASAPYSGVEIERLRSWAYLQGDADYGHSAQALLSLGFGAGLPTRDLARVRVRDIAEDCTTVKVEGGDFPRIVRVQSEWTADLAESVERVSDPGLTLFRPGVVFHKNTVLTFLHRSMRGDGVPSTQRMRVTWLVMKLISGTPMHVLLYEAGLKSMDALVRYQRFFPSPQPAAAQDTTADTPGSTRPPRPG